MPYPLIRLMPHLIPSACFRGHYPCARRNQRKHMWNSQFCWRSSCLHSIGQQVKGSQACWDACNSRGRIHSSWSYEQLSSCCRGRCSLSLGPCEGQAEKRGSISIWCSKMLFLCLTKMLVYKLKAFCMFFADSHPWNALCVASRKSWRVCEGQGVEWTDQWSRYSK